MVRDWTTVDNTGNNILANRSAVVSPLVDILVSYSCSAVTICKIRKVLVAVVVDTDDILRWFAVVAVDFLDDQDLNTTLRKTIVVMTFHIDHRITSA
jgi:hypothetical protein